MACTSRLVVRSSFSSALWLALMMLSAAPLSAGLPAALERAADAHPGRIDAILFAAVDDASIDYAFGLVPERQLQEKIWREQCGQFETLTGVNPMRDIKGLAAAIEFSSAGAGPGIVAFAEIGAETSKLMLALQKDQAAGGRVKLAGKDRGAIGDVGFFFAGPGVFLAPPQLLSRLRDGASTGPALVAAQTALQSLGAAPRMLAAARVNFDAAALDPQKTGGSRVVQGVAACASVSEFLVAAVCDSPATASALEAVAKGWVSELPKQLQQVADQAAKSDASPFGLLSYERVSARVSQAMAEKIVTGARVESRGAAVVLRVEREKLPEIGATLPIALMGVLAAIAVPNFRAARERANFRACYANQKTIAGAMEMFNLDNNTRLATIDGEVLDKLTRGQYLQTRPDDPGQGAGSWSNYAFAPGGNGITCKVHGNVDKSIRGTMPPPSDDAASGPGGIPGMLQKLVQGAKPPARLDPRAECWNRQKTLAGAIEMYKLDQNVPDVTLDRALLDTLVKNGYLRTIYDDPGQPAGSWTNYYLTKDRMGIGCKVHGAVGSDRPGR